MPAHHHTRADRYETEGSRRLDLDRERRAREHAALDPDAAARLAAAEAALQADVTPATERGE